MGADTSICDTMKSSYEKEKRLKKAYYLSLYNEKKSRYNVSRRLLILRRNIKL